MLKKSKSCLSNINLCKAYKLCKSYNDLSNIPTSNLFVNKKKKLVSYGDFLLTHINESKKRKLVSYGEFLRTHINPSKKQRIQAITDFYNCLY
jgi:hypothetical protein